MRPKPGQPYYLSVNKVHTLVLILALASCAKVGSPPGKPELEGPMVEIISPGAGDTLSDSALVLANAEDPSGVRLLILFVDGDEVSRDSSEPYQLPWDTRSYYDEEHELRVQALDRWDNKASSRPVKVFTFNNNPRPDTSTRKGTK